MPDFNEKVQIVDIAPSDANNAQLKITESNGNFMLLGRASEYGFIQSHNHQPLALNPLGKRNHVGIGTTNPISRLHIVGSAPENANDGQLRIAESNGNFILLGRTVNYGFVQSHNHEPLALNPLGNNVGIGTTAPQEKLEVDGNISVTGDIKLTGADFAENFDMAEAESLEPGTVMVIGDEEKLHQCSEAYDKRVAGVISGSVRCRPGIILNFHPSQKERLPLALTGKVYCKVDAQYAPIAVGDLLTTSPSPGHAMKVQDPLKAFGAVIGKALRPLNEGKGVIPILIALQ